MENKKESIYRLHSLFLTCLIIELYIRHKGLIIELYIKKNQYIVLFCSFLKKLVEEE